MTLNGFKMRKATNWQNKNFTLQLQVVCEKALGLTSLQTWLGANIGSGKPRGQSSAWEGSGLHAEQLIKAHKRS